ncbi:MAG: ABC transporter ATP-binding protein [Dehalococcoidia bacterium]|nr:ABC transporter ATP-binding protein [Dehalococcoidia bacterium]
MGAAAPGPVNDIRCEQLRFARGRQLVLDIPALRFAQGRVTALVGPNGSGKSTLLRLISALERPTAGRVLIDGNAVTPKLVREAVAYAFQAPVFVTGSVASNLDLALRLRHVPAAERESRIREAAAACGIEPLLHRDARRLSGGESQRANLARALALRAPVTLLDEPLAGLDAPGRRQLLHDLPRLLRQFASTTIVVTHDRDEALRLADEMVVLIGGRVRAAGSRAGVFARPPDAATARFLGYTIIPTKDGGVVAIAPRVLRAAPGDVPFVMDVEDVLDLGIRREAWGTIAGVQVSVSLPPGEGELPPRIEVSAPTGAVLRFEAGGEL